MGWPKARPREDTGKLRDEMRMERKKRLRMEMISGGRG